MYDSPSTKRVQVAPTLSLLALALGGRTSYAYKGVAAMWLHSRVHVLRDVFAGQAGSLSAQRREASLEQPAQDLCLAKLRLA